MEVKDVGNEVNMSDISDFTGLGLSRPFDSLDNVVKEIGKCDRYAETEKTKREESRNKAEVEKKRMKYERDVQIEQIRAQKEVMIKKLDNETHLESKRIDTNARLQYEKMRNDSANNALPRR